MTIESWIETEKDCHCHWWFLVNKLPIIAESVLYLLTHAEWKTCYFYTLHELLHDVVCKTHVHLLMYACPPQ